MNQICCVTCLLMRFVHSLRLTLFFRTIGKQQFEKYVEKGLVDRSVPITKKIKLNKVNIMKQNKKARSKTGDVKDFRKLAAILSQLYVASQYVQNSLTKLYQICLNFQKMAIGIMAPSHILHMSLLPYHHLVYLLNCVDLMLVF